MKYLIMLFICCVSGRMYAQETKAEFDGHKWEAPYHLPVPGGWTIERFLIPIAFAPEIPYQGVEDIRFAPGWGKLEDEAYWSYAFLWYLDSMPVVDAAIIEQNLKAYYTGLLKVNIDSAKLEVLPDHEKRVRTAFKTAATGAGDLKTFEGTVEMLDFMQLKRIQLNCIAHVKACAEGNKAVLFYELSPQPYTHKIWPALDKLWLEFSCKRK